MKKRIISAVLVLAVIIILASLAVPVFSASEWADEIAVYNSAYVNGNRLVLPPIKSPMANAGDDNKIPSNSKSDKFPGIYFWWPEGMGSSDNGVLMVLPEVFEKNEVLLLTAKNANDYWGYIITKNDGNLKHDSGRDVYVYGIGKVDATGANGKVDAMLGKKINMVFIHGLPVIENKAK